MSSDPHPPQVIYNRFAQDTAGTSRIRPTESCFSHGRTVRFHGERQDTSLPGWRRMIELIEEAVDDGRDVFRPLVDLSPAERQHLVTLPPAIGRLTRVKHLVLYGSPLVRIPPEIGGMESLEVFEPYTSRSLHWFPYEITRCAKLRSSTVSTRGLYGNYKHRPAFPRLQAQGVPAEATDQDRLDPAVWGVESIRDCSVCSAPVDPGRLRQVWISLRVATDVLPLLVNACSTACVQAMPVPAEGYAATPHLGGPESGRPEPS